MAKVREDLVGVVRLNDGRVLSAGDTIPDGVEVGDHLLAGAGDAKSDAPAKPARKTSTAKGHGDTAAGQQS